MSQRIIVGLVPDTNLNTVKIALEACGAESVGGPSPELPDVFIVTIPNEQDINDFIRMAQGLPGVRYVEPDSWQFTV